MEKNSGAGATWNSEGGKVKNTKIKTKGWGRNKKNSEEIKGTLNRV